jgi:valyl-tRNA synthetase
MITMFPVADETLVDDSAEQEIGLLQRVVGAARNLRAEYNVPPSAPLPVTIIGGGDETRASVERTWPLARTLLKVSAFAQVGSGTPPVGSVVSVVDNMQVCLGLAGAIDVVTERARIEKDLQKTRKEKDGVAGRLGNAAFVDRAPQPVVEKERDRLAELEERIGKLNLSLERLAQL